MLFQLAKHMLSRNRPNLYYFQIRQMSMSVRKVHVASMQTARILLVHLFANVKQDFKEMEQIAQVTGG